MSAGIYKITNIGDNHNQGKCYIGLSKDIERRKQQHFYRATTVKGKNTKKLYWAMEEYGFENFSFDILEYCDVSELGEKEIYYIKLYNSFHKGYNSSDGGEGVQKNDLIDRFNLISNLDLQFIDKQDYANPNIINKEIDHLEQLIIDKKQILETKKEKLNFKKNENEKKEKPKKVTKIELKIDLLQNKFKQKLDQLSKEKEANLQILKLITDETKLKQKFLRSINDYVKKSFEELKAEAFNSSIEKKFSVEGPAYTIHNFQKNNRKYQEIKHYSDFGTLNIYSKYLSFKPDKRITIKLLFEEIEEIIFIIYEQNIYINFNGWSEENWNKISKTYQSGYFQHPDSFYLVFSNNEFDKLVEVILSIRRELRI